MSWDPGRYLQYAGERLRPALDLLARVPQGAPGTIVDLGCGAGNVTRLIAERWPQAEIIGIDNDAAMLERARAETPPGAHVKFIAGDLARFAPPAPVDLVYSNAALHWLPDHAALFSRVARAVAPGGTLAVQMPRNFDAPSHLAAAAVAQSDRWRERLAPVVRQTPVAPPEQYLRWLAPSFAAVDVWETIYLQQLAARDDGEHPVVAFVSGTWLLPYFARLESDPRARHEFLNEYRALVARAYPSGQDGSTLFPFRRLFIVATARA